MNLVEEKIVKIQITKNMIKMQKLWKIVMESDVKIDDLYIKNISLIEDHPNCLDKQFLKTVRMVSVICVRVLREKSLEESTAPSLPIFSTTSQEDADAIMAKRIRTTGSKEWK